jgi:carboxyl-terminal processing protease
MTLQPSTIRNSIIGVLLLVLGAVGGYRYGQLKPTQAAPQDFFTRSALDKLINPSPPVGQQNIDFAPFWEVWQLLENEYIDPTKLDSDKMVHGAISGMTSALGDDYTMYLPPVENKRSAEDLAGSFYGVGIELGYIDQTLAVTAPLSGSPAEQAGVKAGDFILRVKDPAKNLDEDSTKWTLNEAVEKIRGPKGSIVTLTLFRKDNGGEPFEVNVVRDEIIVKSVELTFVEHAGKRVAHLKLSRFGERTEAEWKAATDQILAEQRSIAGIVLDVRNNPGGFLEGSIDIASDFIEDGVVVSQKGRTTSRDYKARGEAQLKNIPVLVLVNKGSASAAEIVAGALRDQRNAKLVGEQTFGKGTVQDRLPLSNGGGVHITIARWMLPKGEWIHEEGIPVTVEVKDNPETADADEVLLKGIEEL